LELSAVEKDVNVALHELRPAPVDLLGLRHEAIDFSKVANLHKQGINLYCIAFDIADRCRRCNTISLFPKNGWAQAS
jgi:hypothetical protein